MEVESKVKIAGPAGCIWAVLIFAVAGFIGFVVALCEIAAAFMRGFLS